MIKIFKNEWLKQCKSSRYQQLMSAMMWFLVSLFLYSLVYISTLVNGLECIE